MLERAGPSHPDGVLKKEGTPPSSLAMAIVRRLDKENQRGKQRIAELSKTPVTPALPSFIHELILIGSAKNIDLLISGSVSDVSIDVFVEGIFAEIPEERFLDALKEKASTQEEIDEIPERVNAAKFKDGIKNLVVSTISKFGSEFPGKNQLPHILGVAQAIALEKGVAVESVFANDDSYEELVRQTNTLEEFAQSRVAGLDTLTPENIAQQEIDTIVSMIRAQAGSDEDDSDMIEVVKSQKDDLAYMKRVTRGTNRLIRATKIYIVEELVRFWGEDVLVHLSDDIQRALKTTTPRARKTSSLE